MEQIPEKERIYRCNGSLLVHPGTSLRNRRLLDGQLPGNRYDSKKDNANGKAGYIPTAHFILPENCWLEHFYAPQFPVQEAFLKEYAGNDAAADLITGQRYEESLYNKYKEYYGYVFYIGQKKD